MPDKAQVVEVDVWVLVEEGGDYVVSHDPSQLSPTEGVAHRLLHIKLNVPEPKTVELEATIGDEPEGGELKIG